MCSHALARGFECHHGHTKRYSKKRCERTAKGMPDDPDVCVREHIGNVIVEVLKKRTAVSAPHGRTAKRHTYDSDRIKQTLFYKCLFYTVLITFPPATVAVTNCRPRPVDTCATAAEQQVIVQLIFLRGWPAVNQQRGRAFDGKHDGAVVVCSEDVSTETVIVRFPPDWLVLHTTCIVSSISCQVKHRRRKRTHDAPLIGEIVPCNCIGFDVRVARHFGEKE